MIWSSRLRQVLYFLKHFWSCCKFFFVRRAMFVTLPKRHDNCYYCGKRQHFDTFIRALVAFYLTKLSAWLTVFHTSFDNLPTISVIFRDIISNFSYSFFVTAGIFGETFVAINLTSFCERCHHAWHSAWQCTAIFSLLYLNLYKLYETARVISIAMTTADGHWLVYRTYYFLNCTLFGAESTCETHLSKISCFQVAHA